MQLNNLSPITQVLCSKSKLQYHRARWLSPETGRWLSVDPQPDVFNQSNTYSYGVVNLLNKYDINGCQMLDPLGTTKIESELHRDAVVITAKEVGIQVSLKYQFAMFRARLMEMIFDMVQAIALAGACGIFGMYVVLHALASTSELEQKVIDIKSVPCPDPNQLSEDESKKTSPDYVYRGAGASIIQANGLPNFYHFTPRPGKDTTGPPNKRGLSTFRAPIDAAQNPGDTAWQIDLAKLKERYFEEFDIISTPSSDGKISDHVSIKPKTQAQLDDWASTRKGNGEYDYPIDGNLTYPHIYTVFVYICLTGVYYKNTKSKEK